MTCGSRLKQDVRLKVMNPALRKADLPDFPRMFVVRKNSILGLAPAGMPISVAVSWASKLTIEEFTGRISHSSFWVAEVNNVIVGWIGIRGNEIAGLYVDPQFATRGIGSSLLKHAEAIMQSAGISTVRVDSSWNAEAFYVRQGYVPDGPRPANDTRSFSKSLTGTSSH